MLKIGDRCEWMDEKSEGWRNEMLGNDTYYLCELPEKSKSDRYRYVVAIDSEACVFSVRDVRPYNESNKRLSELEAKQRDLARQQEELADEIAKLKGGINET